MTVSLTDMLGLTRKTLGQLPSGMGSDSAVNGVTGIGLVESGYRTRRQFGGPALGYWQMEPFTHDDLWKTFLPRYPYIRAALSTLLGWAEPSAQFLLTNDAYACAMARVKLFRSPLLLPDATDAEGWANYWKTWYNTGAGAGTVSRAVPLFTQVMELSSNESHPNS